MQAVITGADGLLGNNLTRACLAAGYSVRALVHPASPATALAGLPVAIVHGDVTDAGQVMDAVSGADLVFHVAAVTDLRAAPDLHWSVNLEGTRHVVDACLAAKVGRLLHIGSASTFQFGPPEAPGTEASPFPGAYRGLAYMESKAAASELVQRAVAERGLDAVILAPTFMLGPHDPRPSSGDLIRQFLTRRLRLVSSGGRNFAHVGDVAKGILAAVRQGRTGETYLLGGQNLSYRDFFARVARIAGVAKPLGSLPSPLLRAAGSLGSAYGKLTGTLPLLDRTLADLACCQACYSPARAIRELGLPQTPVDTAIAESIESLRQFGHLAGLGGKD
jgi:dihydroflavonol-4-reductase